MVSREEREHPLTAVNSAICKASSICQIFTSVFLVEKSLFCQPGQNIWLLYIKMNVSGVWYFPLNSSVMKETSYWRKKKAEHIQNYFLHVFSCIFYHQESPSCNYLKLEQWNNFKVVFHLAIMWTLPFSRSIISK